MEDEVLGQALWSLVRSQILPIRSTDDLFNQYADEEPRVDRPGAAKIRRDNLKSYLDSLIASPSILLVGEAAGPWGCRFSGVPFTGERQLLSHLGFPFPGMQSSVDDPRIELLRRGNGPPYVSQSAVAFWDVMTQYYSDPGFIVWDLVPVHPHKENRPLTVRTPTPAEIRRFSRVLAEVVRIVEPETTIAIGRKAEEGLRLVGLHGTYVRHPARGGRHEFARGIRRILGA